MFMVGAVAGVITVKKKTITSKISFSFQVNEIFLTLVSCKGYKNNTDEKFFCSFDKGFRNSSDYFLTVRIKND